MAEDYQFSVVAGRRLAENTLLELQQFVSMDVLMSEPDKTLYLATDSRTSIPVYQWQTEKKTKAVLHISHGMAEYGLRYHSFARELNKAGFIVYAHDHTGHGERIEMDLKKQPGHFADQYGWSMAVHDLALTVSNIKQSHPELPLFLLGHSMGSYLLQNYLINSNPDITGAILSGSNYVARPLLFVARIITQLEIIRQGGKGNSSLINQLTFAGYNKQFKPNRTEFDWLSRDPESVDAYINDPLCGFTCTNQLWADLFSGLKTICSISSLKKINPEIPILVLGGDKDPVSAPNRLQKLASALQTAGVNDVSLQLYPGGRHEMFNETNREQVIRQLIEWLENHLPETGQNNE